MSAPDTADITSGYRVEPAANGGWILYDNTPANFISRVLGAFTNARALMSFLEQAHLDHTVSVAYRAAKQRADKLGLEEQVPGTDAAKFFGVTDPEFAALNWTDEEKRAMQPGPVIRKPKGTPPLGTFRDGQKAVLTGDTLHGGWYSNVFPNLSGARHQALILCEQGYAVTVTDDTGHVVNELTPPKVAA